MHKLEVYRVILAIHPEPGGPGMDGKTRAEHPRGEPSREAKHKVCLRQIFGQSQGFV